jgi:hypothetical protein
MMLLPDEDVVSSMAFADGTPESLIVTVAVDGLRSKAPAAGFDRLTANVSGPSVRPSWLKVISIWHGFDSLQTSKYLSNKTFGDADFASGLYRDNCARARAGQMDGVRINGAVAVVLTRLGAIQTDVI